MQPQETPMPNDVATTLQVPPVASRGWLERLWSSVADRGRAFAIVPAASVPPLERARQLAATLLSERGEASGAAVARELHAVLRRLGADERLDFYRALATSYAPDEERLRAAAEAYLAAPDPARAADLADVAEPPRQELLRRMNMAQGGTAVLVTMRREVLATLRAEPALKPLDDDLRHLFLSWFNRGFLELRRIDWNTSAAVLEKLIAYEAVHEIAGWQDLRRRLGPDRRCFAFFHPALPGEPLIFVEVALVPGLADAVQPLLTVDIDETTQTAHAAVADTAIFYSISNCQDGLRGVSFGNFLIKQVVEELKQELPQLRYFATLSPVPGFRRWLTRGIAAGEIALDPPLPDDADADAEADTWADTWADAAAAEPYREALIRLCARYLTDAPTDPVARFHLGNGAQLERINWRANLAPRGLGESFGVMVNYLYDPDRIEANHEGYVHGGTVARSAAVDALLAPSRKRHRSAR
jgi:malonyl-CoA decarboxylase